MKSTKILEEGTLLVHGVETLGFDARKLGHARRNDFQSICLETRINFADDILGDGIGFDDGQGAFDSHLVLLGYIRKQN